MVDKVTVFISQFFLIVNRVLLMEEDRVTVYFTKSEVSPMVDKLSLFISQMESRVSLMEDRVFISQMESRVSLMEDRVFFTNGE